MQGEFCLQNTVWLVSAAMTSPHIWCVCRRASGIMLPFPIFGVCVECVEPIYYLIRWQPHPGEAQSIVRKGGSLYMYMVT